MINNVWVTYDRQPTKDLIDKYIFVKEDVRPMDTRDKVIKILDDATEKLAKSYTGMCLDKFKPGMRVRIINLVSYRSKSSIDKIKDRYGTVYRVDTHWEKVIVDMDGVRNSSSATGHFYFKPHELEIVNDEYIKEENDMSNITNYFNAVQIKYAGDVNPSRYIFANFDTTLAVGDTCVVKTPNNPLEVATVVEILEGTDYKTDREIVAKVDMDAHNKRVEARAKAAELKAKMQERAKQLQDVALYKMLAESDPAMMELLNEYQTLTNM